jgi:hypothetical protein
VFRGLLHPAAGPLVRVEVSGATATVRGVAVLDTGATMSGLDRAVAQQLGLASPGVAEWHALVSGESRHQTPLRRARIKIGDDHRWWELDLIELDLLHAVEGYQVLALLGWDFLDQCVFSVDGPSRTFSLTLPR